MDKFAIRVITYNLLSPHYATQQQFPYTKPFYLDFQYRIDKTIKLLSSWIKVNFVICLQEVSKEWADILTNYFSDNNYGFVYDYYSSGTLGIGIAYPNNHYDVMDINIFKSSDYIGKLSLDTLDENIAQQIAHASKSSNTMISIYFCAKYHGNDIGKRVMISNYHMPCKFMYEYFMTSHIVAILAQLELLQEHWNVKSLVLAGDFNMVPDSNVYKQITGILDSKTAEHIITSFKKMDIDITKIFTSFNSAHCVSQKKEPKYTNVCLKETNSFVDCIDYIFINENVSVMSCMTGLTVSDPYTTSYPNGLCPSDHIPLSASLFI